MTMRRNRTGNLIFTDKDCKGLIKVMDGIYCESRVNSLTGEQMIACNGGFHQVALEVLDHLGIEWENVVMPGHAIPNSVVYVKGGSDVKIEALGGKHKLKILDIPEET